MRKQHADVVRVGLDRLTEGILDGAYYNRN